MLFVAVSLACQVDLLYLNALSNLEHYSQFLINENIGRALSIVIHDRPSANQYSSMCAADKPCNQKNK